MIYGFSSIVYAAANVATHEEHVFETPLSGNIQIPIELNYNTHLNADHSGHETDMIVKPVIPMRFVPDWDLISRSEIPLALTHNITPNAGKQFGLSDIEESLYLTPRYATHTFLWGIGPKVRLVTADPKELGLSDWGIGPTVFLVYQQAHWTVGGYASQLWKMAGAGNQSASLLYLEPHVTYTTKQLVTYNFSTQSTYNWINHGLAIPLELVISKKYRLQNMSISIGAGLRYWAVTTTKGAKDFGGRLIVNFILPNKFL